MIGSLRGILLEKRPPQLLIEVQGIGYEVEAPMSTFYVLGELGSEIKLCTHLVVREDAHLLFGFASEAERQLFRALIKVSGVGAKIALTILSGISANDFARCVQNGDVATLTRLPGVGKKTAERLVVEMRDKLTSGIAGLKIGTRMPIGGAPHIVAESPREQAIAALIALGYKAADATRMTDSVSAEIDSTEEIIRHALKRTLR